MKKFLTIAIAVAMLAVFSVSTFAVSTPDDYLAYFSFDDAENGLKGGNAYAAPNNKAGEGAAVIIDNDELHAGSGSLRLSNADPATLYWLEARQNDGSALLKDLHDVTISFWSKTNGVGPSWTFFATPIVNDKIWLQVYMQEYYIGLLENASVIAQRFYVEGAEDGNSQARTPELVGNQYPNQWKFVTVTFNDEGYTLYVNGEWMSEYCLFDSTLPDLLREDHIFYIGASTWVTEIAGENFVDGWVDEFYVFPYCMEEAQVINLYVAQGGEAPEGWVDPDSAPADTEPADTQPPETKAPDTKAPETKAPDTQAPDTQAPEEEKSGCGSAMGAAAVIVALTATLGCAIVKKH